MPIEDSRQALAKVRPFYESLLQTALMLIRGELAAKGIRVLSVEGRVKTEESFTSKVASKNYSNPVEDMTDICGIRIISYLPNQTFNIIECIRELFEIDEKNSSDRADVLGDDRVGYTSNHLVCTLGKSREKLPEYRVIYSLKFEIQIRTVLQHAWAELAHGKSYKFSSRLPSDLQRQLNLQAGALELIDRGLADLSDAIDRYAEATSETEDAVLSEHINTISLINYFSLMIAPDKRLDVDGSVDELVDEVTAFGIERVRDMHKLVDATLKAYWQKQRQTTIFGFVRDVLMYADIDRYFKQSFKKRWHGIRLDEFGLLRDRHGDAKVQRNLKVHDIDVQED
jgi:ppGpp synthetase/RelA/SpoT-type nucleotidyltranferase